MATLWRSEPLPSDIRRGMRISLLEAAVVGAMFAATETWLVPLLVQRLGAAAHVIGLLTIIPQLGVITLGAVAHPVILFLGGNRRTVLLASAFQVLLLVGLIVPVCYPERPWATDMALWLSISMGLSGAIGGPAWTAWMGDLIPRSMLGRYLGWRWRIFLPAKLVIGFLFAIAIKEWPADHEPWGLVLVFASAALARAISTWLVSRQPMPPTRRIVRGSESDKRSSTDVTLLHFLRTLSRTDIGRWTMVWSALLIGVLMAGPFFSVYMLKPIDEGGLGLDPRTYWWMINVSTISRFAVVALVGRLVDLCGAAAVLRVAVVGITVIPAAWICTTDLRWLILTEVASGCAWTAAECSVGVLLFSCNRDPLQRVRLIGFHQVVAGCAMVLGSTIGTELLRLDALPHFEGSPFRALFLLSMAMRVPSVVLALTLLPRLRDLDPAETAGLWRMIPGAGVTMTIGRGLLGAFRRPEG